MDMLRLVLLIVGLFVILGVYLWERGRHRRAERPEERSAPPAPEGKEEEHVEKELKRLSGLIATARSDASLEPAVPRTGKGADADKGAGAMPARPAPKQGPAQHAAAQAANGSASPGPRLPSVRRTACSGNAQEPLRPIAARPKDAPPAARAPNPSETHRSPPAERELVIALILMAPPSRPFSGPALVDALAQTGMEHGDMDIFHRYMEGTPGQPLFSIANVVEPGTIDPAAKNDFKSPGLAVFMQLPNGTKPTRAFKEMLDTVDRLAHLLGGIVCDNRRRPLDAAGLQDLWDEVLAFDRQGRTARV
jgi:cell division protein ZipA